MTILATANTTTRKRPWQPNTVYQFLGCGGVCSRDQKGDFEPQMLKKDQPGH